MTVYHFHRFHFELVTVCFCVFKRLQSLERQGQSMGTQRQAWHDFLLVRVPVCFCAKFYVNLSRMAESKSLPDAPQPESRPYHQHNRSVTVLNRVLQISCGPMAQMSPRKGSSQLRGVSRLNGATVPPALRSFACKPIFRSVRSYFFLFQHVCASRMPVSEGFRHGNLSRQRIVGVLGTLLFQIFAQENLFLRRDRRKWNSVPDRKPEERISL